MFTLSKNNVLYSLNQRLIHSPLVSCIAGCLLLWICFGIRQSFGVFLIPITEETGWDRSTFSIAAALLQLLWGFSQPFLVYLAETRFGFGKMIFCGSLFYAAGMYMLYASDRSSGLFIFSMGAVIGISAGGNSFSNILASIGRRYPQNSKQQSMAFGIISSFGSLGQGCFLPISKAMLAAVGWKTSFIIFGSLIVASSPLAYFLQTVPPIPALPASNDTEAVNESLDEEEKCGSSSPTTLGISHDDKNQKSMDQEMTAKEELDCRPLEDIAAPDIKTALIEALTSPIFICVTLGFSSCGFHISFLSTHLPAYLEENGISTSLAAWTISIMGFGSMIGTVISGYLVTFIQPKYILMAIFTVRAILFVVITFIPLSTATVLAFSIIFGLFWLSTVPPTTRYIAMVFGHKYLGTLSSITFIGHQIGGFLGAYLGGVVYDQTGGYERMWYGALAISIFAVIINFCAGVEPINERRKRKMAVTAEGFN